jgi:hypothetical protein
MDAINLRARGRDMLGLVEHTMMCVSRCVVVERILYNGESCYNLAVRTEMTEPRHQQQALTSALA